MSLLNNHEKKHAITIDPLSVLVNIVLLFGLFILFKVRAIIVLLFLAFIIMTALHPAVRFMHSKLRIPRGLAIFISYISFISFFVLLFALVIPPLGNELYQLVRTIDIPYFQEEIRAFSLDVSQLSELADRVGSSVTILFELVASTFSGVFTVLTVLVFSVYLMIDRPDLYKKITWFTKEKKYFEIAEKYLDDLEFQLGGWVRGQFLLMLLIGGVTYIGLVLLGIPYALPLALLGGLMEIVPNLGPTVAAIPAIILAYVFGGPVLAGVVTLFYVVMQQLENNLIVPKIMKESADVNPLVAMVVIIMGLMLGGVVGALISVPTYIVFRITYSTFRRQLF
jgi:predicted PurR-regulated permease PerM